MWEKLDRVELQVVVVRNYYFLEWFAKGVVLVDDGIDLLRSVEVCLLKQSIYSLF